jgi:hypothetical protein
MIQLDDLEVIGMEGKPGVAFFDMDHTIVGIDCSVSSFTILLSGNYAVAGRNRHGISHRRKLFAAKH